MSLWKKGIERSKNGTKRYEDVLTPEILNILEGQTGLNEFRVTDCKGPILDIEGSIEIRNQDLEKGEMPFKIGKLSGDLILVGKGKYKKAILPVELEGDIIIEF